jgi:hypothetical protein
MFGDTGDFSIESSSRRCHDQDHFGGGVLQNRCFLFSSFAAHLSRGRKAEKYDRECPMEIRCHECGSTHFRRSRIRLKDLMKLIFLRYPVRCYACYARGYAPMLTAFTGDRKPMKREVN